MTGRRWAATLFAVIFRSRRMPLSPPALVELEPGLSATGKLDRSDIDALAVYLQSK